MAGWLAGLLAVGCWLVGWLARRADAPAERVFGWPVGRLVAIIKMICAIVKMMFAIDNMTLAITNVMFAVVKTLFAIIKRMGTIVSMLVCKGQHYLQ